MNKSKTQPRLLGECELLAEKSNLLLTDNAITRSQNNLEGLPIQGSIQACDTNQ